MTTPLDLHSIESRALRVIAQAKDLGETVPMAEDLVSLVGEVRTWEAAAKDCVARLERAHDEADRYQLRALAAERERDQLRATVERVQTLPAKWHEYVRAYADRKPNNWLLEIAIKSTEAFVAELEAALRVEGE
jgi:hypothetical protein